MNISTIAITGTVVMTLAAEVGWQASKIRNNHSFAQPVGLLRLSASPDNQRAAVRYCVRSNTPNTVCMVTVLGVDDRYVYAQTLRAKYTREGANFARFEEDVDEARFELNSDRSQVIAVAYVGDDNVGPSAQHLIPYEVHRRVDQSWPGRTWERLPATASPRALAALRQTTR